MSHPEVVVFDLGKVLVDFDYGISAVKIAASSRFTPEQVRATCSIIPPCSTDLRPVC